MPTNVGAQDPELRNSPIALESDELTDELWQETEGEPVCYFNGAVFNDGDVVQSGTVLLRCSRGIWVPAGPSDPDNP